jgi:folate-dependent phosphoribosylglycinamide formyltransferase PurN
MTGFGTIAPAAPKIALLTLEALASAEPVRSFVYRHADRIAMVALSDPFRPGRGSTFHQLRGFLRQSGVWILPYLAANFLLPIVAGWFPWRAGPPEKTPMARLCAARGIPVATISDMNAASFHDRLRASGADILVTFHCDQILTAKTIACPPLGGLNVHAGLLPEHRGPVPTIHALLENPPAFGVTIHRLVPRIDAGEILARARLELPAGTSALAAARLAHEAAGPMLAEILDRLRDGRVCAHAQTPMPYRGFPTARQLRTLRKAGRSVAGWRDMSRALRTPV